MDSHAKTPPVIYFEMMTSFVILQGGKITKNVSFQGGLWITMKQGVGSEIVWPHTVKSAVSGE